MENKTSALAPLNSLLSEIPDPPSQIYYRGDPNLLRGPCLAIVGTRRPSATGIRAAMTFARSLARSGLTIVSGLARGVDSAAHRGAMREVGKTIAVLGNGLDLIYPPENFRLAEEIVDAGGCIISEYPPGTPPLRHHFPARNRLISGLSLGTLIVEAAEKSGSLITARMALEQNRDVFAIPGGFDDAGFCGGHRLIQFGAKLVTRPDEILMELPPWALRVTPASPAIDIAGNYGFLEELFGTSGENRSLEELMNLSADEPKIILSALENGLEKGWVVEQAFQTYLWIGN